ncbi:MAG: hypothetical protein A4E58_01761 [Syntrophorhabdus sp. PtaB.Bin006]|nr:MAG: hypothetical protein A4E58_01761 [Syntrophorhabdus sp. PtaB.Bin006]
MLLTRCCEGHLYDHITFVEPGFTPSLNNGHFPKDIAGRIVFMDRHSIVCQCLFEAEDPRKGINGHFDEF